jgi:heme oxygenase
VGVRQDLQETGVEPAVALRGRSHWNGSGLREALRTATLESHERLHFHRGFAAIAAAQISRGEYCGLLTRLLGLYLPLELALGLRPERSLWLQADLRCLYAPYAASRVPLCRSLPRVDNHAQQLGARYVIEGAALGGQVLAKRLDALLGHGGVAGRRFFIGRGTATAFGWRSFLAELHAFDSQAASRGALVQAAADTFGAFEHWLSGWSSQLAR